MVAATAHASSVAEPPGPGAEGSEKSCRECPNTPANVTSTQCDQHDSPQPAAGDHLLTTKQVLQLLGVCRTTLYHLVRAGELTPIRFGRCVRFLSSEVTAFIAGHRT